MKVFLNGEYIDKSDAKISVDDRGFHFGDGLYDIMLVHNSKLVDFEKHLDRVENTAKRIFLNLDYKRDEIYQICKKLLEINNVKKGRAILVLSRGEADRWLVDTDKLQQNFLIYVQDYDAKVGNGILKEISAKLYEDIRWKYRDIKVTSLLPSVILRNEANKEGFDEVLYHEDGLVNETSRGNIYIVKGNIIKTPPLSERILPGITRYRILQLLNDRIYPKNLSEGDKKVLENIKVIEENFTLGELLDADEVFSSSATVRVAVINKIDDKVYTQNKVSNAVLNLYDLSV